MQADNRTNALSGHLETQMAFFVGGGGAALGIAPGEPALVMPGTTKRSISFRSPVFGSSVSVTISFAPALPTYMVVAALAAADVIRPALR